MISPDRLLEQQQIYDFLRTVTIKYNPIAQYINGDLVRRGFLVNDQDPTSWKYYLNMVGQYHVSDSLMYVISLDTRETILFSPETLANNLRTRAVYQPGGSYYNRLCEAYPEQVDLIKSILFPVDNIVKAIMAPDLTLLMYGEGYLEPYEQPIMINEIEKFLAILVERWYFDFLDDEPYFYLTFWASVPVYLAMLLMSMRMENLHTPYVHSSHIWYELGGEGLDNYSDVLDREKSMFLYQNINYLKANAGKQSNLNILADRLLRSLGIGLYGRIVVQEAETGKDNFQLTPQLVSVKLPVEEERLPAKVEIKTVATVQSEIFERGLTSSISSEKIEEVQRKLGDTIYNEFATKFLEIRPITQHKPYAELLNVFLMETVTVSVIRGYYTKPVEIIDPLTKLSIYLPPKELLALYSYATFQSMGIELTGFPSLVRLYKSFNTTIGTPDKHIPYINTILRLSEQVDVTEYLSDLEYDEHIDTPVDFSNNVTKLWLRFMEHHIADQNTLLDKKHQIFQYLATFCHTRREESIDLVDGYDTYDDWLGAGGIDIFSTILTQYDIQSNPRRQWANLADAIISNLIPLNDTLLLFGNFTLSDSGYERLRQLFIQMCSYRVVFLESERDTPDYSIGAKWSTRYGPDHTLTYAELISMMTTRTVDTTIVSGDLTINPGVTKVLTNVLTAKISTELNLVTKTTGTHMSSRGREAQAQTQYGATMVSQGALTLAYNPTIPIRTDAVL